MKPIKTTSESFRGCFALLIFLFASLVTACSGTRPENNPREEELSMSAKQRQAALSLESAQVPQLIDGNSHFAIDLYNQLAQAGDNLVFSPHSLSIGLAMTYAGARGASAEQMANVLHFTLPQEQLHPAFNSLDQSLEERGAETLHFANAIWGSQSTSYLAPFLDTLAENYGAGIHLLDFNAQSEAVRRINQWVSDQTATRIPELLPPDSIQGNTDLVLTNAIYFQAAWANPFPESATREETFTRLDGEVIPVKMMSQVNEFQYGQIPGVQVIELPYEGGEFSMLVILPDAGTFETFAENLDTASLAQLMGSLQPAGVQLCLPRFQFDYTAEMKKSLVDLGMVDAFGDADFSGMDGSRELFIDQIYHQAMISVDEAGTEAAAASAVTMSRKSMPLGEVTLSIDHPFLFLVRDTHSGAIVFLGQVLDPGKE